MCVCVCVCVCVDNNTHSVFFPTVLEYTVFVYTGPRFCQKHPSQPAVVASLNRTYFDFCKTSLSFYVIVMFLPWVILLELVGVPYGSSQTISEEIWEGRKG